MTPDEYDAVFARFMDELITAARAPDPVPALLAVRRAYLDRYAGQIGRDFLEQWMRWFEFAVGRLPEDDDWTA